MITMISSHIAESTRFAGFALLERMYADPDNSRAWEELLLFNITVTQRGQRPRY